MKAQSYLLGEPGCGFCYWRVYGTGMIVFRRKRRRMNDDTMQMLERRESSISKQNEFFEVRLVVVYEV